jgi:HME family heavy-metal exporter
MFKFILDFSLNNRVLIILSGLILTVYGVYTLSKAPVDVFPNLNKPNVTIMTEAGGMASEEVEQLISAPLEVVMNGLPGVETVRSVSSPGLSIIYVTFNWSTDLYRARQMVAERLASAEAFLPANVDPKMGPISSLMGEILQIAIPLDASKISPMVVREYADWLLRPRLMAIPGVAQVINIGGEVRQYQVLPDTRRMAELGVSPEQLRNALIGFSANTSGGFLDVNGREYLIRNIGRTNRLEDLQNLSVGTRSGQSILLSQFATVRFGAQVKRGDAGFNGMPAVILGIQKQPTADTLVLTQEIETALNDIAKNLPAGMAKPQITFRQANFIEASITTLKYKLILASFCVGIILYAFLGSLRPALIALTSIPLSIFLTGIVFELFDQSINTMTLGGIAIAIGGLVDDAVVDVENIIRRLTLRSKSGVTDKPSVLETVRSASIEVRSGIIYATLITIIVFVPLFALPGIEGRFFVPLAIAFIVSILGSLFVSITITPVLGYYLLPRMAHQDQHESRLVRFLKKHYEQSLTLALLKPKRIIQTAVGLVVIAILSVPFFPTSFLPPFNEGSLVLSMRLNPGTTLTETSQIGTAAENLIRQVPEVSHVGRRSGRAEMDEHAEGVYSSEVDVGLIPISEWQRSLEEITQDIRQKLAVLPVSLSVGQPISHRIDHMLSGVRTQIAIRIVGENLDVLRAEADKLREKLRTVRGIADLEIEKQVLAPQIQIAVQYDRASQYGLSPAQVNRTLQNLIDGERVSQVIEGNKRFALVIRLPEADRTLESLQRMLISTPMGSIPLSQITTIEEADGPNQISRDAGKRRILISTNTANRALSDVVADIRQEIAGLDLPPGYFVTLGGQFTAQEEASKLIGLLSLASLALIFGILYSRYRSISICAIVMTNIPLAMVGGVFGLWLSGQPLSIASLVGFVALAGISIRNDILKVSHYLNLMLFEGEQFSKEMIIRGSLERLSPVLMTASVTAFALLPLLFEASQPGTEILHPVAVVIFFGLVSSTLLDAFLTPILFYRFGEKESELLVQNTNREFNF